VTKSGKSRERYERYRRAKTVGEYLELGGTRKDLRWDRMKGYVTLVLDQSWHAGWPGPTQHRSLLGYTDPVDAEILRCERLDPGVQQVALSAYATSVVDKIIHEQGDTYFEGSGEATLAAVRGVLDAYESSFDDIDSGLELVQHLAHEAALWSKSPDSDDEVQTLHTLAHEVFDGMMLDHSAHFIEALQHLRANGIPVPKNYKAAVRGEFAEYWKQGIAAEIKNLTDHEVFKWVPAPPGRHLIDSNWAWKVKSNDNGQATQFKCRLVARGFRQIYGVDFLDTMSPVGRLSTFRIQLAEAARRGMDVSFLDIRSAYLRAFLKRKQYMTAPAGVTPPTPGYVMRLDKGLYGLRQSGRRWYIKFSKHLGEWGFVASTADPCLFIKRSADGLSEIRVLLFVDDLAMFNDSDEAGRALKADLIQAIKDETFEFSMGHDDDTYLGIKAQRIHPTCIFLNQTRYVDDLSTKFEVAASAPAYTPSPGGKVTIADCPKGMPKDNPLGERYRRITGALRWLEQGTRPDISTTLSELAKCQSNPGTVHMERLEHLLRYVHTTKYHGLLYGAPPTDMAYGPLTCYTDADWAGDPDTLYSRGGYICTSWGTPVTWQSVKMKAVASSSCESEFMASAKAVREVMYLRHLFSDMGYGDLTPKSYGKLCDQDFVKARLGEMVDPSEVPVVCFGDNKGSNQLTQNEVLHKRSKHIRVSFQISRRMTKAGFVIFCFIPTKENIADLMTKSLARPTHTYLTNKIMFQFREGKLLDVLGNPAHFTPNAPVRDTLYLTVPAGLTPTKGDNVAPTQPSVPSWTMPLHPLGKASPYNDDCLGGNVEDITGALLDNALSMATDHAIDLTLGQVHQLALSVIHDFMRGCHDYSNAQIGAAADTLSSLLGRDYAIVDSGASFTYVNGKTILTRCRPGSGYVSVANGQREQIAQIGSLGPIRNAQKVNSFRRTLVSVTDLVELFGSVTFRADGVFVETQVFDEPLLSTRIGVNTPQRLYSFELDSLKEHHKRVLATLPSASKAKALYVSEGVRGLSVTR